MNVNELAKALEKLGCPAEKSAVMAAQLDRQARMDAARKGISLDKAVKCLIGLMMQGWVAPRGK